MESSPRSPDSSCPDYSFDASLGLANRDQNSSSLNILINSTTGNSVSSRFRIQLQAHPRRNRNVQIPDSSSRSQSYQNNGKSVINFAVGSQRSGSTSNTDSLIDSLSSAHYQNSSLSSGSGTDNFYETSIELHSHNPPPYSKPGMPYFASTSSIPTASKSNSELAPLPKIEHSHASASVSSNSSYSSVQPSNSNYVNSVRKQITCRIIPETTNIPKTLPQVNPERGDTFWSASNVPQRHVSSYHLNLQEPETSAKSPYVETGFKRKSSPILNNSDYLSVPSSSSNCVEKEQSISSQSKKIKVSASPSYVELSDDDVQIIIPETSHSSASGSSLSTGSYHKPSLILGSSLSSSVQTISEPDRLLDNQSSHQTTQDSSSTIHNPLSAEEFEQILDSVWPDLDEIASSTNLTANDTSESDESSSSSIISIHEVLKNTPSFEKSKPSSPILEEVSNDIPPLITLDSSPKDSELEKLKAKQEVENVKEDFKKLIEDELICNICTEVLIKPITLGCSHTFCKFCISEWKEKKRQCPMCRASIKTETPCLFLDNFISKAVEQLDPASVEKRLEIIKLREEEQKKKIHKPPVQPHQPSNVPQFTPLNLYPFPTYSSAQLRPNTISELSILNRNSAIMRRHLMADQLSSMHQRHSNLPHLSSNVPHQASNMPHQSSNVPSFIRLAQNLVDIPSSASQRSSIPLQTSSIPQRSSNIPPQYTNLLHQPNPFNGPTNGFFY